MREVQRAYRRYAGSRAARAAAVREPLGDTREPALIGSQDLDTDTAHSLGWSNTAGLPRPTLQRIGYRLDQDGLWRDQWPALDRTLVVEPVRMQLLSAVISVSFRYLDANRDWIDHWPAHESTGMRDDRSRPAAIEVIIELEDWGEIRRLIEVAG